MKRNPADGLPIVGTGSKMLGVRLPPDPFADVDLDANAMVEVNGKGMSVAAGWRILLPHLIPRRLKPLVEGASGSNDLTCYRMGNGPFAAGAVSKSLELVLKDGSNQHGNIAPIRAVTAADFIADLVATRILWSVDES